ncbi:MAG: phosphatase PAP2 family protein [Candidatus Paceibacterota bacterium]|jgi:membrane-associated phospholipid phosphatase
MRNIFYKFGRNFLGVFRGKNLLWHLLAIILTYFLVVSGFDWKYFVFFNGTTLQTILFSAAVLGGLLPILLPVLFYVVGRLKSNMMFQKTAYAIFQAAVLGSIISSIYKAFTGRLQPALHSSSLVDISHSFQFGFLNHGIFWGWPSSHTTIAFAVAVTLFVLYSKNIYMRIFAIVFALYIGIGVSMSIHWFSDFVAGAIIGSVIGYVVGKAFWA